MEGWIKLHRKILDHPIVFKDPDHFAVWMYLLLNATHTNYDVVFKNKRITLNPGQLITGRKSIARQTKVNESKVQRILKTFEIEQQIEQQTSNSNRLVSILNWGSYQNNEQQIEQQVNNEWTTSEQRVNTNKNVKKVEKVKNVKEEDIYSPIVEHLNSAANKNFKSNAKGTREFINARTKEGYTLEDFKEVINKKVKEWSNTDMEKYLRPSTLFNATKFESYLNEGGKFSGTNIGNNGQATGEAARLKEIAIAEGLIREDGSVEPVGEVDF